MKYPSVLVVDDEPANRAFVRNVLSDAWTVSEASGGAEALAMASASSPDLILMDLDMPDIDGWAVAKALRANSANGSAVPILAYTTMRPGDAQLRAAGMDGRLPKPCSPSELLAAIAPWRPNGATARAHRLGEVFGRDEITRLVARFRAQLVEAVAALDSGGEANAHRIAGVAGTLGFADVSASWLRLSEGDESSADDARRDARLAIAAIDRDFSAADGHRELP